jgi:hypothetical protein
LVIRIAHRLRDDAQNCADSTATKLVDMQR